MKAGPRNGQMRARPVAWPSSERRAARLTAASPGSTFSGRTSAEPPRPFPDSGGAESSPGSGSTRPTSSSGTADPHALRELRSERVRLLPDLDHHRTAEWLAPPHHDGRARLNRALGQIAEHRRVPVGDASEDPLLARLQVG